MKHRSSFYIRKTHRYLGVFIGIQFLFWTLGGLYFSWTNIDAIHGDELIKHPLGALPLTENLISPNAALSQIQNKFGSSRAIKIQLTEVLQKPYYEIAARDVQSKTQTFLVDAVTGAVRENLSEAEAAQIVRNALLQESELTNVEFLENETIGRHHEYREKPLPAWAVNFRTPTAFTVYVSATTGKIEAVRTGNWRIFDFLWMLHTMDYKGRDDINNYLLRAFSVLGLLTIASGFVLFGVSSPYLRKRRKSERKAKDI